MQPFGELLVLSLNDAGCQTRVWQMDGDGESGILRVQTDDGRVYSIHFNPSES